MNIKMKVMKTKKNIMKEKMGEKVEEIFLVKILLI